MKKFLTIAASLILSLACLAAAACGDNQTNQTDPADGYSVTMAEGGSFVVTVQNASGMLMSGVRVSAYSGTARVAIADTRADGTATLSLGSGEFVITVDESRLPVGYAPADEWTLGSDGVSATITLNSGVINSPAPSGTEYAVGSVMYDFTYTEAVSGQSRSLSSLLESHELVLVNVFFTTCGPCATEMPFIEHAYRNYSDKVEIVAISSSSRDNRENIASYKQDGGYTFDFAYDSTGNYIENQLGLGVAPINVIIDQNGVIRMIETGRVTSSAEVEEWFESYLNG